MDKSKIYITLIILLIVVIGILGFFFYLKLQYIQKATLTPAPTTSEIGKEKKIEKEVVLYFATSDGEHLGKEVRLIKTSLGDLPKRIFRELKIGPKEKGLYRILEDNVKLRDIYISGGVGFVDLDGSILDRGMGTTEELLVIYSIVDSLCFSLGLSKIKFLVDGKEIDTFGHIDISNPLYPNYDIIAK